MRERPILFNTEMVMALLNGTKTCTRRVVRYKLMFLHSMRQVQSR